MLAYYVEWHMREAWAELLFADKDKGSKATRDPVAPAQRSEAATDEGANAPARRRHAGAQLPHAIVRNTCRVPSSARSRRSRW
jgi:hypothetical protein